MGIVANLANRYERWRNPIIQTKRLTTRVANPVVPQLPLYYQFQRIGGGLTPTQVSSIINEADTGDLARFVDLSNEFRQKDSHLQSLLGTRETALAGLEWTIDPAVKPGRARPTARAKNVAEFVHHALRSAEGNGQDIRSLHDTVSHLAGGIYHGHAVSETEWIRDGQFVVPRGWRPIAPRRFRYEQSTGKFVWWDSVTGMNTGIDLRQLYPDKFIIHQPRINGDVPVREGLARVLVWAALFRNWTTGDWMRLAELSWKPWRFGVYKGTASDDDIDDLITALDNLTTVGYATHSDRVDIHVEWPERGRGVQSAHAELASHLAREMSKAILGQTLTVEQGERGARSLGEVHDRVRKDIAEGDSVAMSTTIRRDLIAPLVRLNFGAEETVPTFRFVTDDYPDLGEFARGIKALGDGGLRVPQDWVRDRLGIPNPREGEAILIGRDELLAEVGLPKPPPAAEEPKEEDEDNDKPESESAEAA